MNGPYKKIPDKKLTVDWFKNWSNEFDETLGKMTPPPQDARARGPAFEGQGRRTGARHRLRHGPSEL